MVEPRMVAVQSGHKNGWDYPGHVIPSAPSTVHVQKHLPEHESNGFAQLFGHGLARNAAAGAYGLDSFSLWHIKRLWNLTGTLVNPSRKMNVHPPKYGRTDQHHQQSTQAQTQSHGNRTWHGLDSGWRCEKPLPMDWKMFHKSSGIVQSFCWLQCRGPTVLAATGV